jgi:hypothetical protein
MIRPCYDNDPCCEKKDLDPTYDCYCDQCDCYLCRYWVHVGIEKIDNHEEYKYQVMSVKGKRKFLYMKKLELGTLFYLGKSMYGNKEGGLVLK